MMAHTPITNPTELWKRTCHRVSIKLCWNFALFQWEVVHDRRTNRIDSSIDPRGHTRICERDEQQVSPKNHSGNACFLLHATKSHKIVKENGEKQRTIIRRMPAFRTSNRDDRTFFYFGRAHGVAQIIDERTTSNRKPRETDLSGSHQTGSIFGEHVFVRQTTNHAKGNETPATVWPKNRHSKNMCIDMSAMIMSLAYLRSVDRCCRARRHGPVATQRRSTSTEQLFCANGVASTSKRRERLPLAPRAYPPPTTYYRRHSSGYSHTYYPPPSLSRVHTPSLCPSSSYRLASTCILSYFLSLSTACVTSSRLPPPWHMRAESCPTKLFSWSCQNWEKRAEEKGRGHRGRGERYARGGIF